jgi:hypothetical protein
MAKKSKFKVPKRLAGFKIRKKHRKAIRSLVDFVESPEVRGLVASLTGALAVARAKSEPDERPVVRS